MKYHLFFLFVLASLVQRAEAAGYVSNAFVVQAEDNEEILTNRDIACIKIDKSGKDEAASITLTPEARRYFATFTKQNKEKKLAIMVCGREVSKPVIKSTIGSGMVQIGQLNADDVKCLKSSFDTEAVCRDCPVCKGP